MAYLAYVVFKGLHPGVYTSWHETHAQVSGYRGAVYRGFNSLELAQQAYYDYITSGDTSLVQQPLHALPVPIDTWSRFRLVCYMFMAFHVTTILIKYFY